MDRYRVVHDLQGGEFGMGRDYTVEQWRKQAIDWCYQDENAGMADELYSLPADKVIDEIAEYWDIRFRKVRKDKKHFKTWHLTDYEDQTLDEFFDERFIRGEVKK